MKIKAKGGKSPVAKAKAKKDQANQFMQMLAAKKAGMGKGGASMMPGMGGAGKMKKAKKK